MPYPGGLRCQYTGVGAQTKKIINDINPKEQATQSAPHPILTFRVLQNYPQNAGNGISETLNIFKIFRGAYPQIPPPPPPPRGGVFVPAHIVTNSPLASIPNYWIPDSTNSPYCIIRDIKP